MMALGDDGDLRTRLLSGHHDTRSGEARVSSASTASVGTATADSSSYVSMEDGAAAQPLLMDDTDDSDYELVSKRETLVFEDEVRRMRVSENQGDGFFQVYIMNKIQPGSGGLRIRRMVC
jgi:hypothetical protein